MKESKNNAKDIEEALYCFDQGLDQVLEDPKKEDLRYYLFLGRAKSNILIG